MAKAKRHPESAAQQREKVRQQRQQRLEGKENPPRHTQARNVRRRKTNRTSWILVGGTLLVIAIVVGIFFYTSHQSSSSPTSRPTTGPATSAADPATFKAVTHVDPANLAKVGTGGLQTSLQAVKGGAPSLTGPTGKPEFFYYGAEYCPYCAAARWGMVVALSRFGTFSQLNLTTSGSDDIYPNTPTFTFYHSPYSSSYIDFVAVEQFTNQKDSTGNYPVLQTPTPDQQQIVSTYDGPPYTQQAGGYPFIDIGNRYIAIGPSYLPDIFANLSQKEIAAQLSDTGTTIAQKVLGEANFLTAAICTVTHNQPASVCTAAPIPPIEQSLSKLASSAAGLQAGFVAQDIALANRRSARFAH